MFRQHARLPYARIMSRRNCPLHLPHHWIMQITKRSPIRPTVHHPLSTVHRIPSTFHRSRPRPPVTAGVISLPAFAVPLHTRTYNTTVTAACQVTRTPAPLALQN